jgi:glycosyltransferase involved in cell wall biosynthesis
MKKKVLHISAYFAGGTGAACAGLEIEGNKDDSRYQHSQLLLEPTINRYFYNMAESQGVKMTTTDDEKVISRMIKDADIVQLEWWGHPLPFKYLHLFNKINTRLIMWYHISGCTYPYLIPGLSSVPDKLVFTSPCSLENSCWSDKELKKVSQNSCVVSSSGGFSRFDGYRLKGHSGFNIGFLGTLSFVKMYPGIVDYMNEVKDIPGVKFIMIGDIPKPNPIQEQADVLGFGDKIEFTGFIDNIAERMSEWDIGTHLLNPDHYGTTENSLLEMMSMGLPVIAFDQNCEKYIITSGFDGVLIRDKNEYSYWVHRLYKNPTIREDIGRESRATALSNYSLGSTVKKMTAVYDEVMGKEKHLHDFFGVVGSNPLEWYNSVQHPERVANIDAQRATNKSGIGQWRKYYPEEAWDTVGI